MTFGASSTPLKCSGDSERRGHRVYEKIHTLVAQGARHAAVWKVLITLEEPIVNTDKVEILQISTTFASYD